MASSSVNLELSTSFAPPSSRPCGLGDVAAVPAVLPRDAGYVSTVEPLRAAAFAAAPPRLAAAPQEARSVRSSSAERRSSRETRPLFFAYWASSLAMSQGRCSASGVWSA
eukprot:3157286-Pleurochrysis_carterae.AAC.2